MSPFSIRILHYDQLISINVSVTEYYYYYSTAVSSSSVVVLAGAVDYLLDLLSLAKLPPSNTEHFVTAKRTATKAVIGGYFLLDVLGCRPIFGPVCLYC